VDKDGRRQDGGGSLSGTKRDKETKADGGKLDGKKKVLWGGKKKTRQHTEKGGKTVQGAA